MQELEREIAEIAAEFFAVWQTLGLDQEVAALAQLEAAMTTANFWHDPKQAQAQIAQCNSLAKRLHVWQVLRVQITDLSELVKICDIDLAPELRLQIEQIQRQFAAAKLELDFQGTYDRGNAILRLTAGAGGVDAMDWASMLERMYLRFCASSGLQVNLLERVTGEEAGIKTAVYEVMGDQAYGRLKSEHGTHRLVRLSPFNADNLRQTSFAGVEILPLVESSAALELPESDLKIDTFRSGGHGGQSVNTTDSAIRITHLPTGLTVSIQNERSQTQNRTKALAILRAKLLQLTEEQQANSLAELRSGESASFGQQIRNYVLHPYKLVKDTRTKHEEVDVAAVLDGDLQPFIQAFLHWQRGQK